MDEQHCIKNTTRTNKAYTTFFISPHLFSFLLVTITNTHANETFTFTLHPDMKAYTEFISQTILIIVAVGSFCYYLTLPLVLVSFLSRVLFKYTL